MLPAKHLPITIVLIFKQFKHRFNIYIMGNTTSHNIINPVNYECSTCMKTGAVPNIAGRFHIINETECQCNGCKTIYPIEKFYRRFIR